jgi:hypothetical protein
MRGVVAIGIAAVLAVGAALDREAPPPRDRRSDGVWLQRVLVAAELWDAKDIDPDHPWNSAISTGGPRALYVWTTTSAEAGSTEPVDDGVRISWEAQGLHIWLEPTGPWKAQSETVRRLVHASRTVPRSLVRASERAGPGCAAGALPQGPVGLPASVEIWTKCGTFVVGTSGVVLPRSDRGTWFAAAGSASEGRRYSRRLGPARLRPRRVGANSGFVEQPATGAVAFTATEGYSGYVEPGYESVYVSTGRGTREILRRRLTFTLCGRGVQLAWRGSWLLYGAGEGVAAAIETVSGRVIDLTGLLRRLPGARASSHGNRVMSVNWA